MHKFSQLFELLERCNNFKNIQQTEKKKNKRKKLNKNCFFLKIWDKHLHILLGENIFKIKLENLRLKNQFYHLWNYQRIMWRDKHKGANNIIVIDTLIVSTYTGTVIGKSSLWNRILQYVIGFFFNTVCIRKMFQ